MTTPRLEIYVDQHSNFCVTSRKDENQEAKTVIELPIASLGTDENREPATRIGEAIRKHLAVLYPHMEALSKSGTTAADPDPLADYDIAHRLLEKSIAEQTGVYALAIDRLVREAALIDGGAKKFADESWPALLTHLQSFPA